MAHLDSWRWVLVLVLGGAAAFSFLAYISMGIAVGDLIGVPGSAVDVAVMQHRSEYWLLTFALSQLVLIIVLYRTLPFEEDAAAASRIFGRGIVAVLASAPVTFVIGLLIFAILRFPHFLHHISR